MPSKKAAASHHASAPFGIKMVSALDLIRYACDFEQHIEPITAVKHNGKFRLFKYGERIGDKRLVYWAETPLIAKFAVYAPMGKERLAMSDMPDLQNGSYSIPIIELETQQRLDTKHRFKEQPVLIKAKDEHAMLRGVITMALKQESIAKLYTFIHKNKRIIGSFEVFSEEEGKSFTYIESSQINQCSFLRYDYTTDSLRQADGIEEDVPTAVYVKMLNLSEPFPFFK